MTKRRATRFGLILAVVAAALLGSASAALGAAKWQLDYSSANTTVAPGAQQTYIVQFSNVGDAAAPATSGGDGTNCTPGAPPPAEAAKCYTITASFPAGMTPVDPPVPPAGASCSVDTLARTVTCSVPGSSDDQLVGPGSFRIAKFAADVDPGAAGTLTASFQVAGGEASNTATTVDPTIVTPDPPQFGIDAFDTQVQADAAGTPLTQAGGHPYAYSTTLDFNTTADPNPFVNDLYPVAPTKDIVVDMPPGLLGNLTTADRCTLAELANGFGAQILSLCPSTSQVGTTLIRNNGNVADPNLIGPIPVFSMEPPPDAPARLGFNVLGVIVTLDVKPRAGDYGLTARVNGVSEGLSFFGSSLTLWGIPADPSHDPERACPGGALGCAGSPDLRPLFRNPTACTAPGQGLPTTLSIDSWDNPGAFVTRTIKSHAAPGYPYPESEWGPEVGIDGCSKVSFNPEVEAAPTTNAADSPSGLDFHLRVPQDCWDHPEEICQSDLRDAEVKLPAGMTINPSAAAGLGSCSESQIGYKPGTSAPFEFSDSPADCPDSSKIGTVQIDSPLLGRFDSENKAIRDADGRVVPEPLTGSVYLAEQSENPAGSLLGMYLVAEGSGVTVKQFGEIAIGPGGRLTTVFHDAPQQPISDLQVNLFGGSRAALRTPAHCGSFAVEATLTPWSGNAPVELDTDPFVINAGPEDIGICANTDAKRPFDPKLSAGTQNPLAGNTSAFNLRLRRDDGTQELAGLDATLPPGLSGYLKGIPYCSDAALAAVSGQLGTGAAQEQSPSCPAASQVGTVTVGAGAGATPFYTSSGRAYLAGPYKGAPLSLAVVAPAVAGPFDLGSVVVRNALRIDPTTAQITVDSDPFPTALHGIGLDLRDVRVEIGRDHFTLNPTSCDPMSIDATIGSAQGASAQRSSRFQVAGCDRLGFKPKLSLKLKGGTRRAAHPALRAVFAARPGDANLGRVQVALPRSEFLDQAHIKTICTRVQFAAGGGGGEQCPAGSVYGHVSATSPILDYALTGNAYLRSSNHNLPDLVLALHGPPSQPIEIDAVGRIDSFHRGIRTTFATVPDAPLTKVVLEMQGGKKGLLQNSRNVCAQTYRAEVQMDAHNGKVHDISPALRAKCGAPRGGRHH